MVKLISTLVFLMYTFLLSAQSQMSIDSVSFFKDKVVTICDRVAGTFGTKGDKPITYLNLGADYPNTKLTIVIFQGDLIKFPSSPSEYYKGKNVCVTGEVGVYKERYQIIANKQEQIEIKL